MYKIGLRMLTQNRTKFLGLIMSLSFAALIISQQAAIFFGLMIRTYSIISDTPQAEIWVMDPNVKMIDDIKPLRDTDLFRVRSVEGIEWAVPFFKGTIRARLQDGTFQACNLLGVDDATLIGAPHTITQGNLYDLRNPDAIIVNDFDLADKLASHIGSEKKLTPLAVGDTLELNDRRAVVIGICKLARQFQSQPVLYTTYSAAVQYAPFERKLLSFILVKPKPPLPAKMVAKKIHELTGLMALTQKEFELKTVWYYMKNTGIPINFGLAVLLGILIGAAIAGQIFYNFTTDNLPYLAVFSVMGASKKMLAQITILQACWVALLSWNIGVGAAALIGIFSDGSELSFYLPFSLYLFTGVIIFLICIVSSLISVSRIYKIQLAEMFK